MAAGVHGVVLPDGAGIPDAGERLDVLDVQKLSPAGKGEDLFQIVSICWMFHRGLLLLFCRDCDCKLV